ncbi:MAG: hypothetical protein ACI4F5_08400 [Acutalibacteraceae bacterium]
MKTSSQRKGIGARVKYETCITPSVSKLTAPSKKEPDKALSVSLRSTALPKEEPRKSTYLAHSIRVV